MTPPEAPQADSQPEVDWGAPQGTEHGAPKQSPAAQVGDDLPRTSGASVASILSMVRYWKDAPELSDLDHGHDLRFCMERCFDVLMEHSALADRAVAAEAKTAWLKEQYRIALGSAFEAGEDFDKELRRRDDTLTDWQDRAVAAENALDAANAHIAELTEALNAAEGIHERAREAWANTLQDRNEEIQRWRDLDTAYGVTVTQRDEARAQAALVPELVEVLAQAQWDRDGNCPMCTGNRWSIHTRDCIIAVALAKAKAKAKAVRG